MDDLITYSKTAQDPFRHVKVVLQALLAAVLKINLLKCAFFQIELQFLKHLINRDGYKIVQYFVELILHWANDSNKVRRSVIPWIL